MHRTLTVFISLLGILLFSQCKTDQAMVPGYLHIKSPQFNTKADGTQGYNSYDFKDYWVFESGIFKGSYAIPSEFPIQKEGKTVIRIGAGIKHSGQNEERMIYPLVKNFIDTVDFKPNQTDTIWPVFSYQDNAVFKLVEDFDKNGLSLEFNPVFKKDGDTLIKYNGDDAFVKGNNSGKIVLKQDSSILELYSPVLNNMPKFSPTYLEIDYKNDLPFTIGIYATEIDGSVKQIPLIVLTPKSQWNKLYLDLETEIAYHPIGTQFRIFLRFSNNLTSPVQNPSVLFDNLKLIYLD